MSLSQSSIAEVQTASSRASSAAAASAVVAATPPPPPPPPSPTTSPTSPVPVSMSKGKTLAETAPSVSTQTASSKESAAVTSRAVSTSSLPNQTTTTTTTTLPPPPPPPPPQRPESSTEEGQCAKIYELPPPKEPKQRAVITPNLTVTQVDDFEFVLDDLKFRMTSHEMRSVLLRIEELHLILVQLSCRHQQCAVCGELVALTSETAANHSKQKCAGQRKWVIEREIIDGVLYLPLNGILVTYLGFKYLFPIMTNTQAGLFLLNWTKFNASLSALAATIPPVVAVKFEKGGMTLADHNVLKALVADSRNYTGIISFETEFTAALSLFTMEKRDLAKLFLLYAGFHFIKNEVPRN